MNPEHDAPAGADLLRSGLTLDLETRLPVLGIDVRFLSNDAAALDLVERAFGTWRALDGRPDLRADQGAVVRIVIDGAAAEPPPDDVPLRHHMPDAERIVLAGPGVAAIVDGRRRDAVVYAAPWHVHGRPDGFRHTVIEAVTLGLISQYERYPLHAAALVRDGAALLLAGPSGVGKSSLAYAAARAGYRLLAEDVVYLEPGTRPRVWGMPAFVHLPVDSAGYFPELQGRPPALRINGKSRLAIDAASLGALPDAPVADVVAICLVRRDGASASLARASSDEVLSGLRLDEQGFDVYADRVRARLRDFTNDGGWTMHLGTSPLDALPLIDTMFERMMQRRR